MQDTGEGVFSEQKLFRTVRQPEERLISVNAVSLMCGFYDVRYFSRVFRKITGCAPSRYVGNGEKADT